MSIFYSYITEVSKQRHAHKVDFTPSKQKQISKPQQIFLHDNFLEGKLSKQTIKESSRIIQSNG